MMTVAAARRGSRTSQPAMTAMKNPAMGVMTCSFAFACLQL
jgi:acetyl-CoA carboxylase beta subunit